nr:nascent polypeptide-associated complex subunit alpha, muscle-specific form [Oryctolagus cuniculus]
MLLSLGQPCAAPRESKGSWGFLCLGVGHPWGRGALLKSASRAPGDINPFINRTVPPPPGLRLGPPTRMPSTPKSASCPGTWTLRQADGRGADTHSTASASSPPRAPRRCWFSCCAFQAATPPPRPGVPRLPPHNPFLASLLGTPSPSVGRHLLPRWRGAPGIAGPARQAPAFPCKLPGAGRLSVHSYPAASVLSPAHLDAGLRAAPAAPLPPLQQPQPGREQVSERGREATGLPSSLLPFARPLSSGPLPYAPVPPRAAPAPRTPPAPPGQPKGALVPGPALPGNRPGDHSSPLPRAPPGGAPPSLPKSPAPPANGHQGSWP